MKNHERKKLLTAVVIISLLGLLALLHQRGLFPFNKFRVGEEREAGNEIRVSTTAQESPPVENGNCTLAEAMRAASENRAVDACPAGSADQPDIVILETNARYETRMPAFVLGSDEVLRSSGEVIIEGNGATLERPPDSDREFRFLFTESGSVTTIRNLTFVGGKVNNLSGGAIWHRGELTLENCHFRQNSARSGGAIDSQTMAGEFSVLTVVDSTFTSNVAQLGGAIRMDGHGTIVGTSFVNNEASHRGGALYHAGGAIFEQDQNSPNFNHALPDKPSVVIRSSLFAGNRVTSFGGALATNNRAYRNDLQVRRWEPVVILQKDTFVANSATMGGAIFNTANLHISDSSMIQNTVTQYGGGIYQGGDRAYGVSVSLVNVTIARNRAGELGGGLSVFGSRDTVDIVNSTITENAADNSASDGLYIRLPNVTIQNTILANNGAGECDGASPLKSRGHNLFGRNMARCAIASEGEGDLMRVDPQLGALIGMDDQTYGNEHYELLATSPALNAGDPSLCVNDPDPSRPQLAVDQLERERVGVCDIGAIEAVCGDGIAHAVNEEECDDGNDVGTDDCLPVCRNAACGDGALRAGVEICDDGNDVNDDECPNNCTAPTCGDVIVQANRGEQCDDGNQDNGDGCLNTCLLANCGDGLVQRGAEECDDGNRINDDACGNNCVAGRCGDGLKQENEECDDGNQAGDDLCGNDCRIFVAKAPPPPPAPVDEGGAAMAGEGGSPELAQAQPGFDEETGLPDFIDPTDIDGQTVPPPTGNTTSGKPSPTSSDSPDEEEEGNGGGSSGGCSLMIEK